MGWWKSDVCTKLTNVSRNEIYNEKNIRWAVCICNMCTLNGATYICAMSIFIPLESLIAGTVCAFDGACLCAYKMYSCVI